MDKEQENCKYCHYAPDKAVYKNGCYPMNTDDIWTTDVELQYSVAGRYEKTDKWLLRIDNGERDEIEINYCPKCGRKLNA
ncbi:hypothetical protein R4B61_00425 [Fructilactobacillus vespulae]|uniref:hypothetical protein n=1 Tax=Fructilactobacillus vespulae TaxID=1249630 RepID=UPI0039B4FC95